MEKIFPECYGSLVLKLHWDLIIFMVIKWGSSDNFKKEQNIKNLVSWKIYKTIETMIYKWIHLLPVWKIVQLFTCRFLRRSEGPIIFS